MVIGEKNSQLQPMRSVKDNQNGYPLPGGIAGPLSPRFIYKVDWPFRLRVGQKAENLYWPFSLRVGQKADNLYWPFRLRLGQKAGNLSPSKC